MARPRQVSDDAILEATRQAVLEHGPSVPTTEIARRIGLSQAALFKRFGTKLKLLLAALGLPGEPPWVPLAAGGPDDRPVPAQLEELAWSVLRFLQKMVPRIAALKALGIDPRDMFAMHEVPPPVVGQQALAAWFERAIQQGLIRPGNAETLSVAFIGLFQARAFWMHMAGQYLAPVDDDTYVRDVLDQFWRGVAPEEQP